MHGRPLYSARYHSMPSISKIYSLHFVPLAVVVGVLVVTLLSVVVIYRRQKKRREEISRPNNTLPPIEALARSENLIWDNAQATIALTSTTHSEQRVSHPVLGTPPRTRSPLELSDEATPI